MQTPILKYLPDYYRMLILPGFMLLLALSGAAFFKDTGVSNDILLNITWGLAGLCLLLGVNFRSTQTIIMSLVVVASLFVFSSYIGVKVFGDLTASFLYACLSILLPVNILGASFQRGRALFGPDGLPLLWIALFEAGFLWLGASGFGGYLSPEAHGQLLVRVVDLLNSPFIDLHGPGQGPSPIATLFFFISFAVLLVRHLKEPQPELAAGIVLLFTFYLVLMNPANQWITSILHLGGALILIASLVQLAYRMAFLDDLTGLPARRAMTLEMARLRGEYTMAMVDVDHFKKVNDTHGHDTGDQVLKMVARRLNKVTGGGVSYRYGGEEFAVLFAGRTKESCRYFLEALREEIGMCRFLLRDQKRPKKIAKKTATKKRKGTSGNAGFSVTVSIGVADQRDGTNPSETLKAADAALYKAKGDGRNRVVIF